MSELNEFLILLQAKLDEAKGKSLNSTYLRVWKFKTGFRHKIQFDYSKMLGDML